LSAKQVLVRADLATHNAADQSLGTMAENGEGTVSPVDNTSCSGSVQQSVPSNLRTVRADRDNKSTEFTNLSDLSVVSVIAKD